MTRVGSRGKKSTRNFMVTSWKTHGLREGPRPLLSTLVFLQGRDHLEQQISSLDLSLVYVFDVQCTTIFDTFFSSHSLPLIDPLTPGKSTFSVLWRNSSLP